MTAPDDVLREFTRWHGYPDAPRGVSLTDNWHWYDTDAMAAEIASLRADAARIGALETWMRDGLDVSVSEVCGGFEVNAGDGPHRFYVGRGDTLLDAIDAARADGAA